jgi:hypothetical protein
MTNKEEEIMHILWKLKKAFCKSDGGNNRRPAHYNTLSTIVRNQKKDTLPCWKNASILPHHCYRGLQKRVYEYGN